MNPGLEYHLEPIRHPSNALPFFVVMCDHDDLMTSLYKTLGQTKDVLFNSSHVGVEEIRNQTGNPRNAQQLVHLPIIIANGYLCNSLIKY